MMDRQAAGGSGLSRTASDQLPAPPVFFPRVGKVSGVKRSASSTKTPHDADTDERPSSCVENSRAFLFFRISETRPPPPHRARSTGATPLGLLTRFLRACISRRRARHGAPLAPGKQNPALGLSLSLPAPDFSPIPLKPELNPHWPALMASPRATVSRCVGAATISPRDPDEGVQRFSVDAAAMAQSLVDRGVILFLIFCVLGAGSLAKACPYVLTGAAAGSGLRSDASERPHKRHLDGGCHGASGQPSASFLLAHPSGSATGDLRLSSDVLRADGPHPGVPGARSGLRRACCGHHRPRRGRELGEKSEPGSRRGRLSERSCVSLAPRGRRGCAGEAAASAVVLR